MRTHIRFFFVFQILYLLTIWSCRAEGIYYTGKDREIFLSYMNTFAKEKEKPLPLLIRETGTFFLDAPYVGGTLDRDSTEKLQINFHEFDCVTFVESVLALSMTVKQAGDFDTFSEWLRKIRYRDGIVDGYLSRLHYFTEWIVNNTKTGIVDDVTKQAGGKEINLTIDFMSTHAESYPLLVSAPDGIKKVRETEKNISQLRFYYIPKGNVNDKMPFIQEGDVIAITTGIDGLDISHVGFAYRDDKVLKFMHASSGQNKVVITQGTLKGYLDNNKKQMGIIVLRPVSGGEQAD